MTDDASLLRAYAEEGSEAAFTELVRRRIGLVYAAALRRMAGDGHGAAEVTQQVFVAMARHAAALARHPRLAGWLYTATRNAVLDHQRKEQRRRRHELALQTMSAEPGAERPGGPSGGEEWTRLRPVLDAAMDELNERDREAVLLRYFEERALAEIGARLQLTENAARMRVERALDKLRTRLARRGVTSAAAALEVALAQSAAAGAPTGLAANVATGALASAALGGGAAAALGFMSTSKIVVGIAVAVAAMGLGGAVYEARVADGHATEAATLRREQEALRARSVELEGRLAAVQRELAAKGSLAEKPATVGTEKNGPAKESAAKPGEAAEFQSARLRPDYSRLEMEKFRSTLGLKFAPLYRQLKMGPEEIARFETVLVEMQQSITEIWSVAEAQGIDLGGDQPANTALSRMTSDPIVEAQKKVEQLLGPEGYKSYQEFGEEEGARDFVSTLAGAIYGSETPLTGSQGEALTQLVRDNTKIVRTPMADDGGKPLFMISRATDWALVQERMAAILAPAQREALHALAEKKRLEFEQERLENAMAEARNAPGK